MKLITSFTATSDVSSVTIGSGGTLDQTYTDLYIYISAKVTQTTTSEMRDFAMYFNGVNSGTDYNVRSTFGRLTTVTGAADDTSQDEFWCGKAASNASGVSSNAYGNIWILIPNYSFSDRKKPVLMDSFSVLSSLPDSFISNHHGTYMGNDNAVTSISFRAWNAQSDIKSGTSIDVYGVKRKV